MVFVCVWYIRVRAYACSQVRGMFGVLLCYSQHCPLDTGSLTQSGANLVSSKSQPSLVPIFHSARVTGVYMCSHTWPANTPGLLHSVGILTQVTLLMQQALLTAKPSE